MKRTLGRLEEEVVVGSRWWKEKKLENDLGFSIRIILVTGLVQYIRIASIMFTRPKQPPYGPYYRGLFSSPLKIHSNSIKTGSALNSH